MRHARLTWADCQSIIDAEVKRVGGRLRGIDPQDLRQEAAVAASRAFEGIDDSHQGTGASYVRSTVRNALTNLRRHANAAKRCPQSPTGRPLPWYAEVDIEGVEWNLRAEDDPERTAIVRQLVTRLRDELPQDDFDRLVSVFADGAEIARGRNKAQRRQASIELDSIRERAAQLLNGMVSGKEDMEE